MATLLHIITGLNTGGAERSLHSLLSGGLADKHRCHVVSLADAGTFGAHIRALGVPVHCLGMAAGRPSLMALWRLRRILRAVRPDLVQGWMYHGNLAASLARAMAPGRPALVWNIRHSLYDISNENRGTRATIRAGRSVSARPDRILYNSHLARAQHEALGFHAGYGAVIANGFDTALWRPDATARLQVRTALRLGPQDRLIGFVARFHPMKDIPNFLQAIAPLMAEDQNLHCAIIGQDAGPSNPVLSPLFDKLPPARLHVLGLRDDIPALMPGFDLFCLSSNSEAFPNVLGEAMACGVPCVATDVGDSRHLLGDTGRIVAPSDPQELSKALHDMLILDDDTRRALGARARARIASHFSLTATVASYTSLYDALLEGR